MLSLGGCTTLQPIAPGRGAVSSVTNPTTFAGEYDNHEQVWSARATSGVVLRQLALRGLAPATQRALNLPGVELPQDSGPALAAILDTPRGRLTLTSI